MRPTSPLRFAQVGAQSPCRTEALCPLWYKLLSHPHTELSYPVRVGIPEDRSCVLFSSGPPFPTPSLSLAHKEGYLLGQ